MMKQTLFPLTIVLLFLLFLLVPATQSQIQYPIPISPYAEQTAPGSIVFLAYPKYHSDEQGQLVPVQTSLVPSSDAAWDFEVTQGIWILKINKEGIFQAEHEGDVFTYRFNSLGIGRGSHYRPFELGEPDFRRYFINGDTFRWDNVYPDIDVSIRYIHDILKVDVIVKNAFMADLKAEAKSGSLNRNDYLTARFDIPQVLITSKPKQNGKDKDVFAESLEVDQPLYFEKEGKIIHKLRPVEVYPLNALGEPIFNPDKPIRTAQNWNLKENASGAAEMSVLINDLVDLPEGDVSIDPTSHFYDEGFYHSGDTFDTYLDYGNPNTSYGSSTSMLLGNSSGEKRPLLGFSHVIDKIGRYSIIASAYLYLNAISPIPDNSEQISARVYKMTRNWYNSTVTWCNDGFGYGWTGGEYSTSITSPSTLLPSPSYPNVTFNVTSIFTSFYSVNPVDVMDKGFIVKLDSMPNPTRNWVFAASEHQDSLKRPVLQVNFTRGHGISFYTFEDNAGVSDSDFDDQAQIGTNVIQTNNGGGDYVADARIVRANNLVNTGTIEYVENYNDLQLVWNYLNQFPIDEHQAYIVMILELDDYSYAGWAESAPGNNIVLTNQAIAQGNLYTIPVLAHELGHNVGCTHVCERPCACSQYLMCPIVDSNCTILRYNDKLYFENGK